jgi:hypothetical protein
MRDVVGRVVVADVLQGGGDGFDQVILLNNGSSGCHFWLLAKE